MTDCETTASMQEQLARRDHRIAVLEAIVAAKTARIAALEAREGNGGSPAAYCVAKFSFTPSDALVRAVGFNTVAGGGGPGGPHIDPRSLALSRAIAADKPLDAYARR